MGNKLNSNVADAVKAQAAGETPIYQFINLKGGGDLVDLMKTALRNNNYTEVDNRIREGFLPFLLNGGNGQFVPIGDIVSERCKGKRVEVNKEHEVSDLENVTEDSEASSSESKFKEVCWRMDQRGSVGETPLHVCLLKSTSIHANLAKRLLRIYPKLITDIYLSEEYYGENVLHMAIVNEDPAMVKFLLDKGADCYQRACGNFFTPDDQKASKRDNYKHECYDLQRKTNYDGYTYWGEYPLGFAVCLGQEECVRLLIAKNANLNLQDTNGNCALHLIVIHDKKMRDRMKTGKNYCGPEAMFDLLVGMKAELHLKNRQGLTPLALAAKLARKEMFEHIMRIDREVYWIYGNVSCAGYPLEHIDTISAAGDINRNSVTYHVVYGDEPDHLDMIDGTVAHLLHEKWKTFAKFRFFRRFVLFILYFAVVMVAFAMRPGTPNVSGNATLLVEEGATIVDPCYLLATNTAENDIRLSFEILTVIGSIIYIFLSIKEVYHQGFALFFETLTAAPSKTLFLISNCIILLMIPVRATCASRVEDVMAVLALLSTGPYFLFFCRGFRIVGPFVVMIYKMIRTDLLRFFTIYLIFVVGFSQAMFVLFRGYENVVFSSAIESMLGMFRMSLGAFADVYETFEENPSVSQAYLYAPKIIFVIYMILVTLLLVNMLIAMMGHTYESVNESQKEWLRQWAKIILVVEQTVTTDSRRRQQLKYSQPMKDGRRALALRWHLTESEKERMQQKAENLRVPSATTQRATSHMNGHTQQGPER